MSHAATLPIWTAPSAPLTSDPTSDLAQSLAVWERVLGNDAQVIDLAAHRDARRTATQQLHLRRRLGLVLAVLGLAISLVLLIGAAGATADLERPAVSGQVVLEPGETLWGLATQHAPAGADARVYLQAIQDVNGFATADVPAWTVVLLPASVG